MVPVKLHFKLMNPVGLRVAEHNTSTLDWTIVSYCNEIQLGRVIYLPGQLSCQHPQISNSTAVLWKITLQNLCKA